MRTKILVIGLLCFFSSNRAMAQNDSTKANFIEKCMMPSLQERFNYDFDTIQFCDFFIIDGIPIENSPQFINKHVPLCHSSKDVKSFYISNIDNNIFHNSRDCSILMLRILPFQSKKEKKQFISKIRNKEFAQKDINVQYRVNKKIVTNANFEAQFSNLKIKHIEMFQVYNNPNIIDLEGKRVDKLIEIFLFE